MGCFGGRLGSISSFRRFGLRLPRLSSFHAALPSEPGERCRRRCSGIRGAGRVEAGGGGGGGSRCEALISAKSLVAMSAVASRAWWRRFRRLRVVGEPDAGGSSYCPFACHISQATLAWEYRCRLQAYSERREWPRIRHRAAVDVGADAGGSNDESAGSESSS